jgi:diguanylate cyclase (GGDEF)-like protein
MHEAIPTHKGPQRLQFDYSNAAGFFSMKRLFQIAAMVLGCASALSAAAPAPLTSLHAVHALTNAEARQQLPVEFDATVGYSRGSEYLLFVQEGDEAVFVLPPSNTPLLPGDRVEVRGTTRPSFRPIVIAESITLLHHGAPPQPAPADFDQLIRAQHDCSVVTVHAVVRAADMVMNAASMRSARVQMQTDGGPIEANVDSDDSAAIKDLMDAEVEVTGVAAGKFDDKMQQTGVVLYVSSLANIKVLHHASASPWTLPVTPMDQILSVYHVRDLTPRVLVQGTITYYQPGTAIVLQDGPRSLWIATHTLEPLQIGDEAAATGFPNAHDRLLTLTDGEIQDRHILKPITPQQVTWRQLAFWSSSDPSGHKNDLVSIEGEVVTEVRETSQDEIVLNSDGRLFTAIYRHPPGAVALPPMTTIPLGSKIRVTGICTIVEANRTNPGEEVPFSILLRSYDDISIVSKASWITVRHLALIVAFLLAVVFAGGARAWTVERKVRRHNAALAYIERRRAKILEDINGTRPLAQVIEEITELISFKLRGAPCWCQIVDGARLGNCPQKLTALRIVEHEIPARSGPPLGTIFAAFDPLTKPSSAEAEALAMATGLAAVAIETRRLYSDLIYRSEFDLLTDIHNRFSLERYLDKQIDEARNNAGVFALIYIDLDKFKLVNDAYGHQFGDLYLQETAQRMKRQLRTVDMLARLGGDEFAVLLPLVRNRAEVVEIAQRLTRCFDEPFAADGIVVHGAASIGIALYPEDATTKDGLLSAADATMYEAKNTRQEADDAQPVSQHP